MKNLFLLLSILLPAVLVTFNILPANAAGNVHFSLEPANKTTNVGDIFRVDIRVNASAQAIDSFQIGIDYDIAYLKVVDSNRVVIPTTDTSAIASGTIVLSADADSNFADKLAASIDNTTGRITFSLGIGIGGSVFQDNIIVASVRFQSLASSNGQQIRFQTTGSRATVAARAGADVTGTRTGSTIVIQGSQTSSPPASSTPPTTTPPATTAPPATTSTPPQTTSAPPATSTPSPTTTALPAAEPQQTATATFTSHISGTITQNATQIIRGTVADKTVTSAVLTVNGGREQTISVINGQFEYPVTLAEGINTIIVTIRDYKGNVSSSQLSIKLNTTPVTTPGQTALPAAIPAVPSGDEPDWAVVIGAIGGAVVIAGGVLTFLIRKKMI